MCFIVELVEEVPSSMLSESGDLGLISTLEFYGWTG
jgi:hypothetical protein